MKDQQSGWERECLAKYQQEKPEAKKFVNDVGLPIQALYSPLDLKEREFDYLSDLGFPGQYPYTRGITPNMYRSEPFIIRAYSGFGTAEDCNERYKKLLEMGVDEIVIAADLPTQVGYDSDHIMSKGEIGRVGVAIDSLQDMEILFDGIPLNKLKRVSMLGNSIGPIALALFLALLEKQGLEPQQAVVDLQNDPIKEYIARGTYIFPIEPAIRFGCDVVEYCAKNLQHWFPMTFCANHMNAAGGGSTKAAAYALSNGFVYIEELLKRGLTIDEIAPLFTMFLDERDDFFVAMANFRATRKIFARTMKEKYGAKNPLSQMLKITAYAHGRETLAEPLNNIVRIALASLAYVWGGVQYLYNASYDEAISTPTEEAIKISIRMQQILAHEFGIIDTADPLGGSYYLETLTKDVEKGILEEISKVQELGGMLAAIDKGYVQGEITRGAIKRNREREKGERISIGVNKFSSQEKVSIQAFRINPETEKKQVARLARLRQERDQEKVAKTLAELREAAQAGSNLVAPVLSAVKAYTTVGEICQVLREVYGEHRATAIF